MDHQLVTFSNGDIALTSSVPGVMSLDVVPEPGEEVTRVKLPEMTDDEFKALAQQSATHDLQFDTMSGKVIATSKMTLTPDNIAPEADVR